MSLQHTIQVTFFGRPFGCDGPEPARRDLSYRHKDLSVWTHHRHETGFILSFSLEKSSDVRLYCCCTSVFGSHALGFSQLVECVIFLLQFGFNSIQTLEDSVVVFFVILAQIISSIMTTNVIDHVLIRLFRVRHRRDESHITHESPMHLTVTRHFFLECTSIFLCQTLVALQQIVPMGTEH